MTEQSQIAMTSRSKLRWLHLAGMFMLVGATIIIFGPMVNQMVRSGVADHHVHLRLAQEFAQTGIIPRPQFLYHFLVAFLISVFRQITVQTAGIIVELFFRALLSVTIYVVLWQSLESASAFFRLSLAVLLTLGLSLVTPVNISSWHNGKGLYLSGYVASNVYHSPTVELLKPLSLLIFVYSIPRLLDWRAGAQKTTILVSAGLMILSTLSKPNYTIVILPLVCLLAALQLLRKKPFSWSLLIWGFLVPASMILAWQFLFLSGMSRGIGFEPFRIFDFRPDKIVLTALFPITVYILYFRDARREIALNLAWLAFIIALIYMYFFFEVDMDSARNFMWGGSVTWLILVITSMSFLLRQRRKEWLSSRRFVDVSFMVCTGVFGLHLVSGVFWYYLHTFLNWRKWW